MTPIVWLALLAAVLVIAYVVIQRHQWASFVARNFPEEAGTDGT